MKANNTCEIEDYKYDKNFFSKTGIKLSDIIKIIASLSHCCILVLKENRSNICVILAKTGSTISAIVLGNKSIILFMFD